MTQVRLPNLPPLPHRPSLLRKDAFTFVYNHLLAINDFIQAVPTAFDYFTLDATCHQKLSPRKCPRVKLLFSSFMNLHFIAVTLVKHYRRQFIIIAAKQK